MQNGRKKIFTTNNSPSPRTHVKSHNISDIYIYFLTSNHLAPTAVAMMPILTARHFKFGVIIRTQVQSSLFTLSLLIRQHLFENELFLLSRLLLFIICKSYSDIAPIITPYFVMTTKFYSTYLSPSYFLYLRFPKKYKFLKAYFSIFKS